MDQVINHKYPGGQIFWSWAISAEMGRSVHALQGWVLWKSGNKKIAYKEGGLFGFFFLEEVAVVNF